MIVSLNGLSFSNSIDLLSSRVYPSSLGTSIWSQNARPSAGNYTRCVAEDVLTQFKIPYNAASLPTFSSACALPGYDINGMDAIQAIKLSLSAYMKSGQLWDVFVDGSGIAQFVQIYPGNKQVNLDVRMCLSSSLYDDSVKVVVVRGYDAPPVRKIKSGEEVIPLSKTEGQLTPQQVADSRCCIITEENLYADIANETTCEGRPYRKIAIVSFKDPILQAQYKDGVESIYEPTAFERIDGYVIKVETGTTDLSVTYQQSATTAVSYPVPFTGLNSTGTHCAVAANSSSYAKFGYAKIIVGEVIVKDRYKEDWPIFLGISNIKVIGHTVQSATDSRSFTSEGFLGAGVTLFVDERIVHINPPVSKNWHWTYENGVPVVYVYSPRYDDGSLDDYIWDILSPSNVPTIYPYRSANTWQFASTSLAASGLPVSIFPFSLNSGNFNHPGAAWPNLGAGIGTLVYKLIFTVDIDRPSIVVSDPKGNALTHARNLKITYYPIVTEDTPPPVAYNIEGSSGVVDHELDIFDNDPSTVQTNPQFQIGSNTWLESQKQGATIDISLPFLETEAECETTANFLYNLYNNFGSSTITSYSLVCGPDDSPELGAKVSGFDNNLRINEISYSYQHGSSYTVSATLGPIYQNVGSWNTSIWQRRTESVSRKGIITWSAGDGCTYRVRIQGLGEFYAINTTPLSTFIPGQRVSVTVNNNPVES